MAPISVDTVKPSQKQARRPASRIVPAIPHRLSRATPAARPITPEHSHKGPVVQPQSEAPPPSQLQPQPPHKHHVQAPPTPDSRASTASKSEPGASDLAHSPASSSETPPTHTHNAQGQPTHFYCTTFADLLQTVSSATEKTIRAQDVPPVLAATAAPIETKPAANGIHRKPAIPTQLPPPFYPSSGIHTPVAQGSDTTQSPVHFAMPSIDGPPFGPAHDAPAPPLAPYDVQPGMHGQQQSVPRIPPGFAPPQFTPSFFPGHSHHPSDVGAPWLYPPYSMAPPEPAYGNGSDFQSPSFPAGPAAFPDPYQNPFPSSDAPPVMNGTAASHSESPDRSFFGETQPGSDRADGQRGAPLQNGNGLDSERLNESAFELASYLSTQFGNPQFADFVLQIRSTDSTYVSIPVHGIVVVRSPVIADAIQRSHLATQRSRDARRLVDVVTSDPFVTPESLEEAVKIMYGAPLLSMQSFLYGLGPCAHEGNQTHASSDARRRMEQLLSYVAAGRVLQQPNMQGQGVEIAKALVRWDTLDQVLHYGLQAATSSQSGPDGADTHDPFAAALLNCAIDFVAHNFPNNFNLYRIAPELSADPRLPSIVDARPPTHNSRLSNIRFGDAPPEDDVAPNHVFQVLSSVLLSLPSLFLERLFNHPAIANQIGWTGAAKTMQDVVDERENRRQKTVRGQSQRVQDGTIPKSLADTVFLEERIEHVGSSPIHPSGFRLSTTRLSG